MTGKQFFIPWLLILPLLQSACDDRAWNNPYPPSEDKSQISYSSFSERPKHLDPIQSYSATEYRFIGQIYEPPLQYHYLKRPYQLELLTAAKMPVVQYRDSQGRLLAKNAPVSDIAFSDYVVQIKPGIRYQPHPAFAVDAKGKSRYLDLKEADLENIKLLQDFKYSGTRELLASDYVYQIKRMAHPKLNSPIYSLMTDYIVGLKKYAALLKGIYNKADKASSGKPVYLDLSRYDLEGVQVIDRYRYRIRIKGKYPQILYWLAMPFFSPVPPEVDRFYSQAGMKQRNLILDWYPVGTGAYMLTENNPNRRMVLQRNPNFRVDRYPSAGMATDKKAGLLNDAGKQMPFIEKVIYVLEKESIPYWNKFLQGYYDVSGISSDSFDQAIQFGISGEARLTDEMKQKGIRLLTSVETSTFYMGFNMLDPVVGGKSERAKKLRQAISIAVDYEDMVSIFRNGRGIASHSPIPPGIFGYREGKPGINPVVYKWQHGKAKRRSIAEAKKLLALAGYPNGRDKKTGRPLLLYFDTTGGGPDSKSQWDWYKKQFEKINIQLVIRNTDYNRFRDKMMKGNAQIFSWGWNADYPDPENFLFLLYGPNAKVKFHGENAANYNNPEYNRLFEQMKNMENNPERQQIIDRMLTILHNDAPWLFGFHPKSFVLFHKWYGNASINEMAHNNLKYKRIDTMLRIKKRAEWNAPVLWPLWGILIFFVVLLIPAVIAFIRKEHSPMNQPGNHSG